MHNQADKNIKNPPYFLIVLISLLGLASTGWLAYSSWLAWSTNTNEQTALQMIVAGSGFFSFLLLSGWLVTKLLLKIRKWQQLGKKNTQDISYLRGEMNASLRELEIQSQMLFSFMNDSEMNNFMGLASELLRVQNVSFWRINPEGNQMDCMEATAETKSAFKKGDVIRKDQFHSLFDILGDKDCVQYPSGMQVGTEITGEPIEPRGSMLHYVENQQIRAMLIIPLEVEGQVMGAAWFEHRELERKWTERDRKQAFFVASIVRMKLFKDLQYDIIEELAEGLVQFDNFRNQVDFGVGWFRLSTGCLLSQSEEDIKKELAEKAILEEANESMTAVFDKNQEGIVGKALTHFVNDRILSTLVAENFLVSEMEWERSNEEGEREVLKISVFGNIRQTELIGLWLVVHDITELRNQERKASKLIENSSNIITIVNEQFKITSDSSNIQLVGYQAEERVGYNILSYFETEDSERLEKGLKTSLESYSEEKVTTLRMRKADRTWGFFDAKIKNLQDDSHVNGLLLELADISARMDKEDELQAQQSFYSSIIEQSGEVAFVINKSGEIVYESANMLQIFGYKSAERIGHYGFELIHSKDLPRLEKAWRNILDGKQPAHYQQVEFYHKKGSWRNVSLSMQKGQQGSVNIWLKDMTGVRESELLLRNREKLTNIFLAKSDKLFFLTDSKGKIKYASGATVKSLGVEPNKVVGKMMSQLIHKTERGSLERGLEALVDDKKAALEMHVSLHSGKHYLLSSKGQVLDKAFSGLLFELSEQKEMDLDKETSLKASFFQSIAHNFPNALLFVSTDGQIRYANPASQQIFGEIPKGMFTEWVQEEKEANSSQDALVYFARLGNKWQQVEMGNFSLKGGIMTGSVYHLTFPEEELEADEKEARSDALIDKLQAQIRILNQDKDELEKKLARLAIENED